MEQCKFGMPTLIELNGIEENIRCCKALDLDFIEINMNLPEYQSETLDCQSLSRLAKEHGVFYTIHMQEEFDIANFSDNLRFSYKKIFMETVTIAKQLEVHLINIHMNPGVYFTMPSQKIYLYEKYKERYLKRMNEFLIFASQLLKGTSIRLSIENTGLLDLDFIREAETLLLQETFVGLTWDVGHDYKGKHVDTHFYEQWKERITHVHLHDATMEEDHLTLGSGQVDIDGVIDKMERQSCLCVLEVKTLDGLKESVRWLYQRIASKRENVMEVHQEETTRQQEVLQQDRGELLKTLNPTARFSNRVEDYAKYRPHYPSALLEMIRATLPISERTVIADIGAGTGIFTQCLLDLDTWIYGVEPNDAMRAYAEKDSIFHKTIENTEIEKVEFVKGTSKDTTLESNSVDLITVAQAFHWFEPNETKNEFLRILKENGYVMILWNDRKIADSGFSFEYEEILRTHCTEYSVVTHKNLDESYIRSFYEPYTCTRFDYDNTQKVDFDSLFGRAKSSSYVPISDAAFMERIETELRSLFDRYQNNNTVDFEYVTTVYIGRIK